MRVRVRNTIAIGLLCVCTGCATVDYVRLNTRAVSTAYHAYTQAEDCRSSVLIAMLAYTASDIHRHATGYEHWQAYADHFDIRATQMLGMQRVSENYSLAPTRSEVLWYRTACTVWLEDVRAASATPRRDTPKAFQAFTERMITLISDREYVR